jgi:hypothetical protein
MQFVSTSNHCAADHPPNERLTRRFIVHSGLCVELFRMPPRRKGLGKRRDYVIASLGEHKGAGPPMTVRERVEKAVRRVVSPRELCAVVVAYLHRTPLWTAAGEPPHVLTTFTPFLCTATVEAAGPQVIPSASGSAAIPTLRAAQFLGPLTRSRPNVLRFTSLPRACTVTLSCPLQALSLYVERTGDLGQSSGPLFICQFGSGACSHTEWRYVPTPHLPAAQGHWDSSQFVRPYAAPMLTALRAARQDSKTDGTKADAGASELAVQFRFDCRQQSVLWVVGDASQELWTHSASDGVTGPGPLQRGCGVTLSVQCGDSPRMVTVRADDVDVED